MSLTLSIFSAENETGIELPIYTDGISCGVPSPSFESLENRMDITTKLVKNPATTFYAKVSGQSMIDEGIDDGDLLVVDRELSPEDGKIAICFIDGEFTCKRIGVRDDGVWLLPANPDFEPIKIEESNHFVVWGIVTFVIKSFK